MLFWMLHPRPKQSLKGCGFAQPSIQASPIPTYLCTIDIFSHSLPRPVQGSDLGCSPVTSSLMPVQWGETMVVANMSSSGSQDLWKSLFDTPRRGTHVTFCTLRNIRYALAFLLFLIKHLCRCGPFRPSVTHGSKMQSALLLGSPGLRSRVPTVS